MNVLIVTEKGVMRTPILAKNNTTAQAIFNNLAEEFLGDDISEVNLHADSCVDEVNKILECTGVEINWFVDVELNTYKNDK